MKKLNQLFALVLLMLALPAFAGTVAIGGGSNELVSTVQGTWTSNQQVYFSSTGHYRMTLTDFSFPDQFDALGAMVSTATDKVGALVFRNGNDDQASLDFMISTLEDPFYLSIFAITDRSLNLGSFGIRFESLDQVSEVPLPPAAILLASGLLALVSAGRKRRKP